MGATQSRHSMLLAGQRLHVWGLDMESSFVAESLKSLQRQEATPGAPPAFLAFIARVSSLKGFLQGSHFPSASHRPNVY